MSDVQTFWPWQRKTPLTVCLVWMLLVILGAAVLELAMGRVAICRCGHIRFWVSAVHSAENSQQIADWYSFSHLIHGFLLYGLTRWVGRRRGWTSGWSLLLTVSVEALWEVSENSSFIINRYRQETLSFDYYGDSVLNSVSDIACCIIGFFLAARFPVWLTVALAVTMEVAVAYAIRDNLLLNVIMLLHPFEFIKHWQAGIA